MTRGKPSAPRPIQILPRVYETLDGLLTQLSRILFCMRFVTKTLSREPLHQAKRLLADRTTPDALPVLNPHNHPKRLIGSPAQVFS